MGVGWTHPREFEIVQNARLGIALAALWVFAAPASAGSEPERAARVALHFDRNALRDLRVAGPNVVALTISGHLLRFTWPELALVGELVSDRPIAALGDGADGEILAARGDAVLRVDPQTLALTQLALFPETVVWVQRDRSGELVTITEREEKRKHEGREYALAVRSVRRAKHRPIALPEANDSAHLTPTGHLLLGADHGEFGGWIASVDLKTGRVRHHRDSMRGIYGFVSSARGRSFAYGGVNHMGFCDGCVAEIDGAARLRTVFDAEFDPCDDERPAPVTGLALLPSGGFLGASFFTFFDVSSDLRSWKKLDKARVRYVWGRPDAVGSYPAIGALRILGEKPTRALATTRLDGVLSIGSGAPEAHRLPAQLGAQGIRRIESAGDTLALFDGSSFDGLAPWTFDHGSWKAIDAWPDEKPTDRTDDWSRAGGFIYADGALIQLFTTRSMPGRMLTARIRGGELRVLGHQEAVGFNPAAWMTRDGTWWMFEGDQIRRFEDGRWREVGKMPPRTYVSRAVGGEGPPWIFEGGEALLALTPPATDPTLLEKLTPSDAGGAEAKVRSAVPLRAGKLLVASDLGLRVADEATGALSAAPFASSGADVTLLGRDGQGRIWLFGARVHLFDPRTGELSLVAHLPLLEASEPIAVGEDPDARDGVIVSIGERGVLFIRVPESAAP
jgi:hypothetical protein